MSMKANRIFHNLRRGRKDAGYTLLELLVVMGILAVLTAVATPQLMAYFGKAKSELGPGGKGHRVFIHPGGEPDRIRKVQSEIV